MYLEHIFSIFTLRIISLDCISSVSISHDSLANPGQWPWPAIKNDKRRIEFEVANDLETRTTSAALSLSSEFDNNNFVQIENSRTNEERVYLDDFYN